MSACVSPVRSAQLPADEPAVCRSYDSAIAAAVDTAERLAQLAAFVPAHSAAEWSTEPATVKSAILSANSPAFDAAFI